MAFHTAVKKISAGGEIAARTALVLMVVHVCAEAIGRYIFNQPLPMTIEIVAYYYLVALVFLPLASVELADGHTKVELLAEMIGPRSSAVTELISGFLSIGIVALITVATFHEAITQTRISAVASGPFFDLPVWPTRWIVTLGFTLFLVALITRLPEIKRRVFAA